MIIYKCNKCNKEFKQKIDYTRHKNKKKQCDKKGFDNKNTTNNSTSEINTIDNITSKTNTVNNTQNDLLLKKIDDLANENKKIIEFSLKLKKKVNKLEKEIRKIRNNSK